MYTQLLIYNSVCEMCKLNSETTNYRLNNLQLALSQVSIKLRTVSTNYSGASSFAVEPQLKTQVGDASHCRPLTHHTMTDAIFEIP